MTSPQRLARSLIRVSGDDARPFLNNLLTQDLDRIDAIGIAYAALLTPQGKVVADMFVWDDGEDAVILDVDSARGAELLKRLTMYKLRAAVAIEDITGQFHLLSSPEFFCGGAPDPRLPQLGWREVCPLPTEQYDFPDGAAAYERHRLALGVPDLARDAAPDEVFASEALLEELNGVAFDKGCFIGQENVSRMKRRATTRKKFCPIIFDGPAPEYGTPILAGAAELGNVRTGMECRAIALVRLDRALAATARGEPLTAGGRAVSLDPPPWLILPNGEALA